VEHKSLFVGNSYTSANGLHNLYKGIASAGVPGYASVTTNAVTKGGYKLQQHAADAGSTSNKLGELLAAGNAWHAVVLQEQSQIPGFINADPLQWNQSLSGVQSLDARIAALGAHTVLMMTWGRRNGDSNYEGLFPTYKAMQALLTQGYEQYAIQSSTAERTLYVAPVGRAFERIYDQIVDHGEDPQAADSLFARLYTNDGSHPSQLGSTLTGMVIYATITGRDPALTDWPTTGDLSTDDLNTLRDVTRAVVLDPPFVPMELPTGPTNAYPWLLSWGKAAPPSVIDDVEISSSLERPTALIETPESAITALDIGLVHGEEKDPGSGRVVIAKGGGLIVNGPTTVGVSGHGLFQQLGGEFVTQSLTLAKSANSTGRYELIGGALDTQSLAAGGGDWALHMSGGSLRVTQVNFSWTQHGGTWWISDDRPKVTQQGDYTLESGATLRFALTVLTPTDPAPALDVHGAVSLKGTLAITLSEAITKGPIHTRDLIVADSIDHQGATNELPAGIETIVDDTDDGRVVLRITVGTTEPLADPGPDPELNPDPEPDPELNPDPAPTVDAGSGGSSGGGCRTAHGAMPSVLPWLAVLAIVCLTRRRRKNVFWPSR